MPKLTFLGLKDLKPAQQALVSAALIGIFGIACILAGVRDMLAWNILTAPVILYAFMNPVMGIFVRTAQLRYVATSVICFFGLGAFAYVAGSLVSLMAYSAAPELLMITILIVLFYFLSYLLSFLFKGVLGLLEDVDK